jgi:L-amino acid N-acyltransferase YncA
MLNSRLAEPADAAAIAETYNEGIADGVATFETRRRTAGDIASWFDGLHPIIVVEEDGAVMASRRPRRIAPASDR